MISLTLKRREVGRNGCFSDLIGPTGVKLFDTAEHAYLQDNAWTTKIPPGTYTAALGTHELEDGVPFLTYEIEGVEGHGGLLFHSGNWPQVDSKGCVLVGSSRGPLACRVNGVLCEVPAVINSRSAFSRFMLLTEGSPTIQVVVEAMS